MMSMVLVVLTFAGCTGFATVKKEVAPAKKSVNKAQAVVAISPTLTFNNETAVAAFNDIKNAIQKDRNAATLSSLEDDTDFCWAYKTGENWKKRAIYGLDKWSNGKGTAIKTLNAYQLSDDATDSLMAYTTKVAELSAYGETVPDYGLILSTAELEEESLIYTVPQDGNLGIEAGDIVAIEAVDGVKTGFLAEDGTGRSAILRIDINQKRYFSGTLANTTASRNGTAVTKLSYPAIDDIPVKAGDMVFFSLQFNGELNAADDITEATESNSTAPSKKDPVSEKQNTVTKIGFMNKFDPRFTIVYPNSADAAVKIMVSALRSSFEEAMNADQLSENDGFDPDEYEILVGETNRPESAKAYEDLRSARTNYADDYIVRMDGKKLVIAAGSEYSLEKAIELVKSYCVDARSSISSDLNVVNRAEKNNLMLGDSNIGSFVIRTEKYSSYMTKSAAKELQKAVVEKTGYLIPVEKETASSEHEILIGPNTRGTKQIATVNNYEIALSGNSLTLSAGSTTAANIAVTKFAGMLANGNIANGFYEGGTYKSGDYSLSNGYGLTWNDEFDGDWSNGNTVSPKNWTVMNDTTDGPYYRIADIQDKIKNNIGGPWLTTSVNGNPVSKGYIMEGYQTRPGIEGENFFLRDGKLVEVTKKSATGYDAVRLYTSNLMRYRYGFTEVRIKMATRNGACAAVWLSLNGNEIDLNENYGKDAYYSNLHTWSPEHIDHVAAGDMKRTWVYPESGSHFYDEFHYLGFEWTDSYIAFYLDGEITEMCDISSSKFAMFRKTTALKLANGVGTGTYSLGDNPGDYMGNNINSFREEQEVDFVRIYQKNTKKYKMLVAE